MTIFHTLLIISIVGIGLKVGALLSSLFIFIHRSIMVVAGGFISLFFIWPIYQVLGWFPPLPCCPNGHGVNWLSSPTNGLELKWSCRTCGITIVHKKLVIDVLDEYGQVDYHLIKKHPYWLNGWSIVQRDEI